MSIEIGVIEKMSLEEVAKKYNEIAGSTSNSLSTWQQIYFIKKQEQANDEMRTINKQMLMYTKVMTILTVVVALATIITLVVVLFG